MSNTFETTSVSIPVNNDAITIEHGRIALQANGAVLVSCGETSIMVTAVTQPMERTTDFMPLTVNYVEKMYAAGKIPGSYFRREIGRPSDHETLVSRLIDRPIRPLFPEGFRDEVQVIATVISADDKHDPDVLSLVGASAAMHISDIPFLGPIAGARIGYIDGEFVLNPTYAQQKNSTLNLLLAGTRDAVVMVEGGAHFLKEDLLAEAIQWGHKAMQPMIDAQEELRSKVGKEKLEVVTPEPDVELEKMVEEIAREDLEKALGIPKKMERYAAKRQVKKQTIEALAAQLEDTPERLAKIPAILQDMEKTIVRQQIVTKNIRIDGRDMTTVRPLTMQVGVLPRAHGSAIFTRGETKSLCTATLGSSRDEQRIETLTGEMVKPFMLHYNFPPFCVGEARPLRAPGRREIGHGALSERAIAPVLPSLEDFPYTTRIVSEILESNGSSSMASVCGGTLALMDAGVPISAPVAGIAMGLIKEGDEYRILTDILGDEDHLGDMDFKVAGTAEGVTAIQMDIKIAGIPSQVMAKALEQARAARLHILEEMAKTIAKPRTELSTYAPQMEIVYVDTSKIRDVIGPGGKNIKAITAATDASIDIEDSGKISIFACNQDALDRAKEMVLFYDQKAEPGKDYDGVVKKIMDFGAFIEILPGLEGLCHISQLARERVNSVEDVVREGDPIKVKVIEVDPSGKIRLSRKAVLMEEAGETFSMDQAKRPSGGGNNRNKRHGGNNNRRR
ncbi:polyribonucleotide nucleotidyltransferase [Desulfoplanes formicivorans]|uniref:Polyribonucleotide nucleotidyltransferase n=1 Tax=Desulfoplanes formicivorans TaxID=1592317 RepID=A0A194AJW4_9BACT|nr:polyribonucleotide nucleotidyltransferase [Desulfoplanes formicivorans]GAU09608.1 polynucleotide phosphorylase/polyadenylase [Desulfoplanes formicivorans]